jgi:hypothetical protein
MEEGAPAVWVSSGDGACCAGCGNAFARGDLARLERGSGARCLACAGLADLALLPSGDPALTRRAAALSPRHVLVLEFNRRRKRNERRGTLVEAAALERARAACEADRAEREGKAEKRRAREAVRDAGYVAAFAAEVRRSFPGCPEEEAAAIARHACEKHSGRVGRSAAAKEFDPETVELAVRAHLRHVHTDYDRLRDGRLDKRSARDAVRDRIDGIAERWRSSGRPGPPAPRPPSAGAARRRPPGGS